MRQEKTPYGPSEALVAAEALVADLTRYMVSPGSDVVFRVLLARSPAQTLEEFAAELLWSMRFHGVPAFEGSELPGCLVRLGRPCVDTDSFEPDPARGLPIDPAVWSPLIAAFAAPACAEGVA